MSYEPDGWLDVMVAAVFVLWFVVMLTQQPRWRFRRSIGWIDVFRLAPNWLLFVKPSPFDSEIVVRTVETGGGRGPWLVVPTFIDRPRFAWAWNPGAIDLKAYLALIKRSRLAQWDHVLCRGPCEPFRSPGLSQRSTLVAAEAPPFAPELRSECSRRGHRMTGSVPEINASTPFAVCTSTTLPGRENSGVSLSVLRRRSTQLFMTSIQIGRAATVPLWPSPMGFF